MFFEKRLEVTPIPPGGKHPTGGIIRKTCINIFYLSFCFFLVFLTVGVTVAYADIYRARSEAAEQKRLEEDKEFARREGDTIYLKTKSGSEIQIGNAKEYYCIREYDGYLREVGFYVVFEDYGEGSDYLMISDTDGKEYRVYERPYLSPDKRRIVTASPGDAFNINGVFVWRIEEGQLINEFYHEPHGNGFYTFVKWVDDKAILLFKETNSRKEYCMDGDNFMSHPTTLRQKDGEWIFHDDMSKDSLKCE